MTELVRDVVIHDQVGGDVYETVSAVTRKQVSDVIDPPLSRAVRWIDIVCVEIFCALRK